MGRASMKRLTPAIGRQALTLVHLPSPLVLEVVTGPDGGPFAVETVENVGLVVLD